MKRVIWLLVSALLISTGALAQGPTLPSAAPSEAQESAIRRGVALHDEGKFDEAIALYEGVLKENAAVTTALYELAYSLMEKKDYQGALDAATRGTRYRSDELPMFYDLVASAHDSMGEPEKAIESYKQGIAVVPDASVLYYNMAITYLESLKNPDEARRSLERAALIEPTQGQIHVMLGQVFESNGYPVPSLLAFATALALEPNSSQAIRAYGFMRAALRGGVENAPAGGDSAMRSAPTRPTAPAKIDEGDFSTIQPKLAEEQRRFIAALDAGGSEIDALVPQVTAFFAELAKRAPGQDATTFTGRFYVPFFVEIHKRGFVEPFLYWSIQRAPVRGVKEWLAANDAKVKAFVAWAKDYPWPQR